MKHIFALCLTLTLSLYANVAFGICAIYNSDHSITMPKEDALYKLLSNEIECPQHVIDFKQALEKAALKAKPTMVANRGFHNPTLGSFSFFEIVHGELNGTTIKQGDFFFGHFTKSVDNQLVLDQAFFENNLMIELIVWDPKKQLYNFYELRGAGSGSQWFYRGDSLDALQDNIYLHRDPPINTPKFGDRMRCSACHNSGGPIMKEINLPHNDWWLSHRPLPLGSNEPDKVVSEQISALIDADFLSQSVMEGIQQLENSLPYQFFKNASTLQEQLRPLFCEVEINLQSDTIPLNAARMVEIPSAFFISPFLYEDTFLIDNPNYNKYLVEFDMRFPETSRRDADHGWLVPVKGTSDIIAIESLIDKKIIDRKFAAAVLSTDQQNVIFSANRCELLKLVPQQFSSQWLDEFLIALKSSSLPHAEALYLQLTNAEYTFEYYVNQAKNEAFRVQNALKDETEQKIIFKKLIDSRLAVFESEISKNPLGQILEPGFRVIFPEVHKP